MSDGLTNERVGPMSPARILELNQMTPNVTAGKVFITARAVDPAIKAASLAVLAKAGGVI